MYVFEKGPSKHVCLVFALGLTAVMFALPLLYIGMFVDLRTWRLKQDGDWGSSETVHFSHNGPRHVSVTAASRQAQANNQPSHPPTLPQLSVVRPPALHFPDNTLRHMEIPMPHPWGGSFQRGVKDNSAPLVGNPTSHPQMLKMGPWDMEARVSGHDARSNPRRFIYEAHTTGDAYRLPLPQFLDDGDRGGWLSREQPFSGCRSIDNSTCRYAGSGYGSTMGVHTYASFNSMPHTPCVNRDFGGEITYHNVRRVHPRHNEDLGSRSTLIDQGVDGLEPDVGQCEDTTLIPLMVPQGAYFAHFMNGVMPRLSVALALREKRGTPENIHIVLYPDFKSDDTVRTIQKLANVTVTFSHVVPLHVCYKRIVSVCYSTPGFDPRIGTEINRVVRNAFLLEDKKPSGDFENVMQTYHNANVDRRESRHAIAELHNPLLPSPRCTTRVYASRKKNNHNGRSTPNEMEVITHLRNVYNFTVFEGGESLDKWVAAMKNACIFVGAHGGAMSHMFWLNPELNPAVIEFDGYNKYSVFWYLASTMGFNFGWMGFDRSRGVDLARLDQLMGKFGVLPATN